MFRNKNKENVSAVVYKKQTSATGGQKALNTVVAQATKIPIIKTTWRRATADSQLQSYSWTPDGRRQLHTASLKACIRSDL